MTPEVVLPVEPLEMLVKDKLYVLRNAVSNETCEHLAKEYLMTVSYTHLTLRRRG